MQDRQAEEEKGRGEEEYEAMSRIGGRARGIVRVKAG